MTFLQYGLDIQSQTNPLYSVFDVDTSKNNAFWARVRSSDKIRYSIVSSITSPNDIALIELSSDSTSPVDFNQSVESATKNFQTILDQAMNSEDDSSLINLDQIRTWYKTYKDLAFLAINIYVSSTGDSHGASLALDKIASIKDVITRTERKDFIWKFLESKYIRLRYAAISGLFYLGDANDLSKINDYKGQEKAPSLQQLLQRLVLFLKK